ncbi:hypothetical protein SK128_019912, partial [Halocaridina rubra]
ITDAEDDYTVTADQRAALMELETLTWNYPTPQQARGCSGIATSSFPTDEQTDTDDDDDEDSYYVDMLPYDMTERLKEVNRAFIEDPTPAECNRTITIRFREVIADYQSPRDYYVSDSDDGYGDSSDLVYDAEEESGLTPIAGEVKDALADNVNVIDFITNPTKNNGFSDISTLTSNYNGFTSEVLNEKSNTGHKSHQPCNENGISLSDEKKTDIPRLQLSGKEEVQPKLNVDNFLSPSHSAFSTHVPSESTLLKVDDRGLADLESFMKTSELEEDIVEELPEDAADSYITAPSSLKESSEKEFIEKGFSSLDVTAICPTRDTKNEPNAFFQRKETKDLPTPNQHILAKSETDFVTFEYDDDFEDFQEDDDENKPAEKEKDKQVPQPIFPVVPNSQETEEVERKAANTQSHDDNKHSERKSKQVCINESPSRNGHRSRRDQSSRKSSNNSAERSKKHSEGKATEGMVETPSHTPIIRHKPKRVTAGPPTIKPALLSSEKINHIKTSDPHKHKPKNSSNSRSTNGPTTTNSSPACSASSSPSSTISSSSVSPGSIRARGRTPISGPVRPTQHKSPAPDRISSRGTSNSPVRILTSPLHQGLALTPNNPSHASSPNISGRPSPPYRVRKAASASDLHSSMRLSEEPEDRRKQSEAVFKAWLQQKNKQAAMAKK